MRWAQWFRNLVGGPPVGPEAEPNPACTTLRAEYLRPLPYPFTRYVTLNSDCDGSIHDLIGAAVALNTVIREEYGLPVCDSFFGKWLYECGLDGRPEPISKRALDGQFDPVKFVDRCAEWIRGFHRGWFDTVHGWAYSMCVRVAPDMALTGGSASVSFSIPPVWEEAQIPRYLEFRCDRDSLSVVESIHLERDGTVLCHWNGDISRRAIPDYGGNRYIFPIDGSTEWSAWVGEEPIKLVARCRDNLGGTVAPLSGISLFTELRKDIATQLETLADMNLGVSNFSSHAGGLVFAVTPDAGAAHPDAVYHSDDPESPHYCPDLLLDNGIESIQTFAKTHGFETVPLTELAYTRTLRDGTRVYDYHRFLFIPKAEDGTFDLSPFEVDGVALNPSWADSAAKQIEYCLEQAAGNQWHGAAIYTHLNYGDPSHPFMQNGVSRETICDSRLRNALRDLAIRYFGLDPGCEADDRVFVAPTSMLVRMSAVGRLLEGRIDTPRVDQVRIRSIEDPVLRTRIPRADNDFRDLRGLTFYVDDSHSAHLDVDGEPVNCVIRNPADASGRQSLTVADMSAPAIMIGRISTTERNLEVDCDDVDWHGPAEGETGSHRAIITGSRAAIEIRGCLPALSNRQYVAIEYTKGEAGIRYALSLTAASGATLGWSETDMPGEHQLVRFPAWASTERRLAIMPFWQIASNAETNPIPTGPLARVRLSLHGAPGDEFTLHRLILLRDNGKHVGSTSCSIGGLTGSADLARVVVQVDGERHDAEFIAGGYYRLAHPVPRGQIVRIEGILRSGSIIPPCGGWRHEIVDDDWDLDFS